MAPAVSLGRYWELSTHPRGVEKIVAVMVLLDAAFDDSGTHDSADLCVVAGYLGSTTQWQRFENRWRDALLTAKIPEFHAEPFFHRDEGGPYFGMKESTVAALLNGLVYAVRSTALQPIAASVRVKDFFRFNEGERRYLTGAFWNGRRQTWTGTSGSPNRPFYVPFQWALGATLESIRRPQNKVNFTFDRHHVLHGYARDLYKSWQEHGVRYPEMKRLTARMGRFADGVRSEEPALQAADALAFCWHRVGEDQIFDRPTPYEIANHLAGMAKDQKQMIVHDYGRMAEQLSHVDPVRRLEWASSS